MIASAVAVILGIGIGAAYAWWRVRSENASAADVHHAAAVICERMLRCNQPTSTQMLDCIELQERNANRNAAARRTLIDSAERIAAECGSASCDALQACAIDAVKHAVGAGPLKQPLTPRREAQLVALMCDAIAENKGELLDVHAPDAGPKVRAAHAALRELDDIALAAELMKKAMASCAAGSAAH